MRIKLERIADSTPPGAQKGRKETLFRPGDHYLTTDLKVPTDLFMAVTASDARLSSLNNATNYVKRASGERILVPELAGDSSSGVMLIQGDVIETPERVYKVNVVSLKTASSSQPSQSQNVEELEEEESIATHSQLAPTQLVNNGNALRNKTNGDESEESEDSETTVTQPIKSPNEKVEAVEVRDAEKEREEGEGEEEVEVEAEIEGKEGEKDEDVAELDSLPLVPIGMETEENIEHVEEEEEKEKESELQPSSTNTNGEGGSEYPDSLDASSIEDSASLDNASPVDTHNNGTEAADLIDLTRDFELAQQLEMEQEFEEQRRQLQEANDAELARRLTIDLVAEDERGAMPVPVQPVASRKRSRQIAPGPVKGERSGAPNKRIKHDPAQLQDINRQMQLLRQAQQQQRPAIDYAEILRERGEPDFFDLTGDVVVPVYNTPAPAPPPAAAIQNMLLGRNYPVGVPYQLPQQPVTPPHPIRAPASYSPEQELGMLFGNVLPHFPAVAGMFADAYDNYPFSTYARGARPLPPGSIDGSNDVLGPDIPYGRPLQEQDLQRIVEFQADVEEFAETVQAPELTVKLYDYQRIAQGWMTKRETKGDKPCGGILADDMGCGKTVETIACMLANKREGAQRVLIVAPVSLVYQWERELREKSKGVFHKIHVYHGPNKIKDPQALKKYDVVITTYTTLAFQLPERNRQKKGPLLRVRWYRAVLDEAHLIKNRQTRAATACCELIAKRKWCLTGTPIQNGLADLYSLFKFLDYDPYCGQSVWADLVADVNRNAEVGFKKLRTILKAVCLRRRKEDTYNGRAIVPLPEKLIYEDEIEFSEPERDFYTALETAAALKFNNYLRAGIVMQHYSEILVLLLRLRQACSHPTLVVNGQHLQALVCVDGEIVNADKNAVAPDILGESEQQEKEKEKEQEGPVVLAEDVLRRIQETKDQECPFCLDVCSEPVTTRCGHVFCADCMNNHLQNGGTDCPICRAALSKREIQPVSTALKNSCENVPKEQSAIGESEKEDDDILSMDIFGADSPSKEKEKETEKEQEEVPEKEEEEKEKEKEKENEKEKEKEQEQEQEQEEGEAENSAQQQQQDKGKEKETEEDVLKRAQANLHGSVGTSTKIEQLHAKLLTMLKEDRFNKGIVFSQWTSMLDIVGKHLEHWGIKYRRIDGTMSMRARARAIDEFRDDDTVPVMLLSLKVGGLGLNLTMARFVFLLDLWWNPATEQQAIDRVHRLGQTKPVIVYRFTIKNTVEQRIREMQDKKKEIAEGALGTGSLANVKLTLDDLKSLFLVHQ